MHNVIRFAFVVLLLASAPAHAGEDPTWKPLRTLVNAVRYGKDDLAIKQLDGEAEGKALLGDDWATATPDQRKEFTSLFDKLFAGIAFPKIKENLKNLSTTLYEKPVVSGNIATVESTIVIDHPLKKQEMKVRYDLHKAGGWKVVDVTVLGSGAESMLIGIRKEQIIPIMQQGGWPHLLDLMRQRLASIQK